MFFISVFAYSILSGGDRTAQVPRAFPKGRFAVEDTIGMGSCKTGAYAGCKSFYIILAEVELLVCHELKNVAQEFHSPDEEIAFLFTVEDEVAVVFVFVCDDVGAVLHFVEHSGFV